MIFALLQDHSDVRRFSFCGGGEAFLAQGLLLGQSTASMYISFDFPLTQFWVTVMGRCPLFIGTSKASQSHFPPRNWWQTQAMAKAPWLSWSWMILLSDSVTLAWYQSIIYRSSFLHSERVASSTQVNPRIQTISHPSQSDCRKQMGQGTYLTSSSVKRHLHSSPVCLAAQAELGSELLTSAISSICFNLFYMTDRLSLQFMLFWKRVASAMILSEPVVWLLKQSLQRRAAMPALKDPTITISCLFFRKFIEFRQLTAYLMFCDPRKWSFLFLQEMGAWLPRQLPPSQLFISTLGQLLNIPPQVMLRMPLRKSSLPPQLSEEAKSVSGSSVMNLQHYWRVEARSYLKHHPKSVYSQKMRSLLTSALVDEVSGRQVQMAQGEPSRQLAPFLVVSQYLLNMLMEWAPRRSRANRALYVNISYWIY